MKRQIDFVIDHAFNRMLLNMKMLLTLTKFFSEIMKLTLYFNL